MNQIGWSEAPDWATALGESIIGGALLWVGDNHYSYVKDPLNKYEWSFKPRSHSRQKEDVKILAYRSRLWNGEGLPPAGTVCELRNVAAETEWSQATIAFASRNVIVWDWVDEPAINGLCTAYAHAVQLRPIRTPEQLAAEARESGARQICIDAMADPFDEPTESQMIVARRLYDKGYRIFEIVDEAKE